MENNIINSNIHNNLLFILKNNWYWILLLHKYFFKQSLPDGLEINNLCRPIGITGSNFNNSSKLTIEIFNPCYLYYFNDIKPVILLSINEFFKSKVINELHFIYKT